MECCEYDTWFLIVLLPVVFIVYIVGDVLEVLHVGLDEELSQEGEVGMLRVVDLHVAPRILTHPSLLPGNLEPPRQNYLKWRENRSRLRDLRRKCSERKGQF